MRIKFLSFFLLSLFLTVSCKDSSDSQNNGSSQNNLNNTNNTNNTNNQIELPPLRCIQNPNSEFSFSEVTAETSLDASHLHPLGNRIGATDINSDGYPDLIIHKTNGNLRDATNIEEYKRGKRILLNIPDPTEPSKRIFSDFTAESGYDIIPETGERGRGASFAVAGDFNKDGNLDLLSVVYKTTDDSEVKDYTIILYGDGSGHFTPDTFENPFSDKKLYSASSAALLDYNKDGNTDIFIGHFYQKFGIYPLQDRLYENFGNGEFDDVTTDVGIQTFEAGYEEGLNHKPTFGVTVCDVNSDGFADLISSSYGRAYNMLFIGSSNKKFTNVSISSGFYADDNTDYSDNQFYACHCVLNHGPECDEVPPVTPSISCNTDYWNVGFDDQSYRNAGNTFTTVCADFDNDGYPDLYNAEIRHWHIGQSSDPSQLLHNTGDATPVFERPGNDVTGLSRTHSAVDWNEGDITAFAFDVNNDGLLDLYVGDTDYPDTKGRLFVQNSNHTFSDKTEEVGLYLPRAGGGTWLDYDNDGDLDLAIGFSTMRCSSSDSDCIFNEPRVRLFRNDGGNKNNKVAFKLEGANKRFYSPSIPIGAVVKVTVNGTTQIRELQSGFGHMGIQTPLVLYFGLGSACMADKVEIMWPDNRGQTIVLENVPANYIYYVKEESGIEKWEEFPVD